MQFKKIPAAFLSVFVVFLGFSAVRAVEAQTTSVASCNFTKNLEVGSSGDDVLCLQKYLNKHGFKIAETGVGSPDNETTLYGGLTREAVKRWQAARGVTPTGIFGPLSQEEHLKHIAFLLTNQLSSITPAQITSTPDVVPTVPLVNENSKKQKDARSLIQDARKALEVAQDDIDDADSGDIDTEDAQDDIDDSTEDLLDALYAFVDEDYEEAIDGAQNVIDAIGN